MSGFLMANQEHNEAIWCPTIKREQQILQLMMKLVAHL